MVVGVCVSSSIKMQAFIHFCMVGRTSRVLAAWGGESGCWEMTSKHFRLQSDASWCCVLKCQPLTLEKSEKSGEGEIFSPGDRTLLIWGVSAFTSWLRFICSTHPDSGCKVHKDFYHSSSLCHSADVTTTCDPPVGRGLVHIRGPSWRVSSRLQCPSGLQDSLGHQPGHPLSFLFSWSSCCHQVQASTGFSFCFCGRSKVSGEDCSCLRHQASGSHTHVQLKVPRGLA